ncbi:ABC transporter substrate-binding protein [Motilimonas cestriensis]|uniref:ABC transporter substrate-binding protein n=1 Tax=Motilimonas cestriensis TaxID=2742685 RepID=A0ABS8WGM7_9GAMM|nr:ABC transporter substrate-binding protein [Motilimonas cestriensis]MCE2597357.1 ABC transporter substrate-binding protein [Motilimonas cestriensis]
MPKSSHEDVMMRAISLLLISLVFSSTVLANNKIVSAGATITEIIYALGAQQQLVGTDVTSSKWHNGTLPDVGYHRALTVEGLLSLTPDLLIASKEAGPDTTLQLLQQAGVNVRIVSSGNRVADLKQRINEIAQQTGRMEQASNLNDKVDALANQLQQQTPAKAQQQKAIFLLLREGSPASLAGKETPADAIINLMGATNPAAATISSYKPASAEALLAMAPDVILVSHRTLKALGSVEALLAAHPMLAATPAGQARRVFSIAGTSLIGELGISSLHEALRLNNRIYGN